jgi:alcohol dehydrogenase class IV
VNLLATDPGELLDYVNRPVGEGRAPSRPLDPLVAVPTTTGTGAESTTICVLDVLAHKVKTGISHPRLRPTLAVVDPALTVTQPAAVTAASGMDVLCHALESWTAKRYTAYDRKRLEQRVPYCGANPISDMWSEQAMRLLAGSFRDAVRDGDDLEARGRMALAATMAGLGFGNAGVGRLRRGRRARPGRGTMKQQRLLDTAPRPVTEDGAAAILVRSLSNW